MSGKSNKNTGKLPATFRLLPSWSSIFLGVTNLWLFSRVLTELILSDFLDFLAFLQKDKPLELPTVWFNFYIKCSSLIYMEFILAYCMKYGFNFNFYQITIQLSQLHLLKSLSFLQYFKILTSSTSKCSILFDWSLSTHIPILLCTFIEVL